MKNKFLRRTLALAMAATMMLTGCATKENSDNSSTPATGGTTTPAADGNGSSSTGENTGIEPCEIIFWHAMSNKQEACLTEITDAFNAQNEYGIKVTLVNQGKYSDLSTKLTANASADTLPDLAQAYNNWLTPYLDKIVHLDDFVANMEDYEDIIESYRNECSEFGFVHAIPFNKSTYVYFYNKTMFDELGLEAPKTWADLENIGKVFKEQKGMVSLGYDDLAGMLASYMKQNDCEYVTADGAQFDNEKGMEALTFILNMYSNEYARLVGEDGYFSTPLSNQTIAAYVGSSTGASYITADGWELGVAPLPGNVKNAAYQAGTNVVMFSKDANKQKAAFEYLTFLINTENTTKWAMATGYLPVRTSAYESAEYQAFMANDPSATAAYAQSDSFFSTLNFDGSYDVMSAVNSKIEELVLYGTEPEEAMKELVETINEKIK